MNNKKIRVVPHRREIGMLRTVTRERKCTSEEISPEKTKFAGEEELSLYLCLARIYKNIYSKKFYLKKINEFNIY